MKGKKSENPDQDEEENEIKVTQAIRLIEDALLEGIVEDRDSLQSLKMKVSKNLGLISLPSNSMILSSIIRRNGEINNRIHSLLIKKPSRTLSGVAVVAVMTSPHDCPHGKCLFCPGGTSKETPTPQSYTGKEPAAMRAAMNDYDPFRQTRNRINQLEEIGHSTNKIDLILMGGTLTARDMAYQESFVKGCLDAMNGSRADSLQEAQEMNETSSHRCIGMTFETRPDHFNFENCRDVLRLGGTRIELGVQSTFDEPLIKTSRGHLNSETKEATRIAKDAGLKVGYHLMPGLPSSSAEMDIISARKAFENPDFRPDMIKIYPTLVVKGTKLFDQWKNGEYEPLDTIEAARIVAEIKRITPPWIRIQRVQRDIPTPIIEAGVDMSNLRQVAGEIMRERGWKCRCIRCREVGHRLREGCELPPIEEFVPVRREYDASGGKEIFLSLEDKETDSLLGYIRIREPSTDSEWDLAGETLIVRELKVFGRVVPLGQRKTGSWQHKGSGRRLLEMAETIARDELRKKRMIVTSGIGVREYYRTAGYERQDTYMTKVIK
jgi:elongator complex protein 3